MTYKFYIPEIPRPMQSVRATKKGFMYQTADTRAYKDLVRWYIREQLKEKYPDFTPLKGAVRVIQLWYVFPPKATLKKAEKQRMDMGMCQTKPTKPDLLDNLSKGFCDALSGILYEDDARIVLSGQMGKLYHTNYGTYLEIAECDEWMEIVPLIVKSGGKRVDY